MYMLTDLEAAVQALSTEQKRDLARFLLSALAREGVDVSDLHPSSDSVLDIPTVSLGAIRPGSDSDTDLLGKMLEKSP